MPITYRQTLSNDLSVSGGGASGEVTFFTGPYSLSGDSSFTWDNTLKILLAENLSGDRVAFGSTAAFGVVNSYSTSWNFSESVTDFTPSTNFSLFLQASSFNPTVDLTGGNAKFLYGSILDTGVTSGNTKNFEFLQGLNVATTHAGTGTVTNQAALYIISQANSSGSITNNIGEFVGAYHTGTGSITLNIGAYYRTGHSGAGGSVGQDYTLLIDTPDHARTLDEHYGLFIENQNFGTINYAIFTELGKVHFGDNVDITGTLATTGTINKVTITAPATGSTLTVADGKTLTASNTLTFTGTDSSSVAFGTGGTVAYVIGPTTFTPTVTLVGGAGNTVPQYVTNSARYTQIGRRVFCDVLLSGDGGNEGAGTGQINIALPVNASASAVGQRTPVGYYTNGATAVLLGGTISASASTIAITVGQGNTSFTGADQNNTTRTVNLRFDYEV